MNVVYERNRISLDHYLVAGAPEECWEWTGTRTQDGYGKLGNRRAHRVAWEQTNGPIPDGMHVLHRCDNPPCCNPAHLLLGTNDDNIRDKMAKGRHRGARGEASATAKLKTEDIPVIRRLASEGVTQKQIAAAFGVGQVTIFYVIHRMTWRHIP